VRGSALDGTGGVTRERDHVGDDGAGRPRSRVDHDPADLDAEAGDGRRERSWRL
jgi:hypothetical protein